MSSDTAPLSMEVIIVGAGLCGVTTAFRLCQLGHRVHVIDKGSPNEVGLAPRQGGAYCPPNLTKCLDHWGLGKEIQKFTVPARAARFISLDSGEITGYLEWEEDVIYETGADYLLIGHQDLWNVMYNAAVAAGALFSFETLVTSVEAGPPRVRLSNGQIYHADMIIGADGPRSIVREAVTVVLNYGRATVSRNLFKHDQELYEFTAFHPERPEFNFWTGDGHHGAFFVIGGGEVVAIHLFLNEEITEGHVTEDVASDGAMVPIEALNIPGEPKLQRLLKYIPELKRTRMYNRKFLEDWVDESGRLLLMSEAAYPILPYSPQSGSLQIEDAAVLTTLLAKLKTKDQIPNLLSAFHEIRQCRVETLYNKEYKAIEWFRIPPGEARNARDEALRAMMGAGHKGWDESKLKWQWEEIADVFGYHAIEAAEDWWMAWGILRERSEVADAWGNIPRPLTQSLIADCASVS
ncbi:hypothetical protein J3A83DRAFT_4193406 [Scleroderma citrinum]